jgi:hypothetical protein
MFRLLREQKAAGIRADVAQALSSSNDPATGKTIFEWFMDLKDASDELLGWACRALAAIEYRAAIPEFIRRLKEKPQSRLGELILISLAELKAKEAMPELINLLEQDHVNPFWCAWAISEMVNDDESAIIELLDKGNVRSKFGVVLAAAMTGIEATDGAVLEFAKDPNQPSHQRWEMLSAWGTAHSGFSNVRVKRKRGKRTVSQESLDVLFGILREHIRLSSLALMLLLQFNGDLKKLVLILTQEIPQFSVPFTGREFIEIDINRLREAGHLLRPWINQQLAFCQFPVLLRSCAALAELLGDASTWDAVLSNREGIARAIGINNFSILERRLRGESPPRKMAEGHYDMTTPGDG